VPPLAVPPEPTVPPAPTAPPVAPPVPGGMWPPSPLEEPPVLETVPPLPLLPPVPPGPTLLEQEAITSATGNHRAAAWGHRVEFVSIVYQLPRRSPGRQANLVQAAPDQSIGITNRWMPAMSSPRAKRLGARITATASNRLQSAARWMPALR